jgi:hypothetical protein
MDKTMWICEYDLELIDNHLLWMDLDSTAINRFFNRTYWALIRTGFRSLWHDFEEVECGDDPAIEDLLDEVEYWAGAINSSLDPDPEWVMELDRGQAELDRKYPVV